MKQEDLKVKVNIDDKISKLLDYTSMGGGPSDGLLSTLGKVIDDPNDKSFHRLNIKHAKPL